MSLSVRRAPLVLSATAVGLAATLGFHAHQAASPATASAAAASAAPVAAASSSSSSSSSTAKAKAKTTTVTGDAVATQYGDVQLKVTVAGGKITAITAVQLPGGDPKSSEISSYAEPLLTQSALSRQSADVDAVSGATYTSNGYRTALQSALDKAGFATSSGSST